MSEKAKAEKAMEKRATVADLALAPDTAAYLFIARHQDGEHFSMPMVSDRSGSEEADLIANYIAVMSDRTGRDREELLREIVASLNDIHLAEERDGGDDA